MYTKSNEIFEKLELCPGLDQFPDLCYHWENDEWYNEEQRTRKKIVCKENMGCDTTVLQGKERICCKEDCLTY